MSTNNSRSRYFRSMRNASSKWAFYEAQPAHVRVWFQNLPLNLWPCGHTPVTASLMADTEARHLAGLEAIWGPDHPAVIDARQRVHVKRGKIQQVADLSDLDNFNF